MAPSPTGSLHIGTARTALFNLLFAKNQGGTLILRIEDTDVERSTKASELDILSGFAWLGITFDEGVMPDGSAKGEHGPYRQMERLDIYEAALKKLLAEHKAYHCFCSKEELEATRINQETSGQVPKYSGKCRSITDEESAKRIAAGEPSVIRIKVPTVGTIVFTDLIRGEVSTDIGLLGDMVISKGLRQPLYNFAVVIDDETMQISHVIRGEDHLANTPKQLLIAEALGYKSPKFAHLPIILSATGKGKMSKRDGGTTIKEYRDAGYLPQAIMNFLGLLGWHPAPEQSTVLGTPGQEREIFTLLEMAERFTLDRVQKAGAKFNIEKLNWFSNYYIRQTDDAQLLHMLKAEFLPTLIEPLRAQGVAIPSDEQLIKIIALTKERISKLSDFLPGFSPFIKLPTHEPKLLMWKKGTLEGANENLNAVLAALETIPETDFVKAKLEEKLMPIAESKGRGDVLWPLRVALSGSEFSPGPFDILEILGKHESLLRIEFALTKLAEI
jgi:nondiscriminating glutamyl-tRNA synthetase